VSGTRPTVDERESVLRRHLRAVGDAPLLSAGEELAAAATVADGRQAELALAAMSGRYTVDLEEASYLRERSRLAEEARDGLIASTRRLVVALVRRHPADAERTKALIAAGDEALRRAVDRYDPTGGLAFSAFARWWIERALREVEHHPSSRVDRTLDDTADVESEPADAELLTALGHLHEDDCRVIDLRLGLSGPALSGDAAAKVLGIDLEREHQRETQALAKLRHPSTPGDLSHLRKL
jgi:RNA polymerase sigma factor (sigma-70 family)